MKLWTTEAGFRVAGIMNWAGQIQPGQVSAEPVSALDLLPTFSRLAKVGLPSDRELDGASFLPALKGQPIKRKPLVRQTVQYRQRVHHGHRPAIATKAGRQRRFRPDTNNPRQRGGCNSVQSGTGSPKINSGQIDGITN